MCRCPTWPAIGLAALALTGAAGCGTSDGARSGEEADAGLSEEQRAEAEREAAAEQIPEADRIAYYQLATVSGLLRSWAIAARRGVDPPPGAGRPELRAAARRVTDLDPGDEDLDRAARRLHAALLEAARPDFDAPDQLIRASDAVNSGLERFVRRNPAATILVPD